MAFSLYERKGEKMAENEVNNTTDCGEDINTDNNCIQVVQIQGGYAPIDYRTLSHRPTLDMILDPIKSKGSIADAGAVGEQLFQIINTNISHEALINALYKVLYENQILDDLDDTTVLLGEKKQTDIGNRLKKLEENKLDKSIIDNYETKVAHQENINNIKVLIKNNETNINSAMSNIYELQEKIGISGVGIELITDWNVFSDEILNNADNKHSSGWYYAATFNGDIQNGPQSKDIANSIQYGDVKKLLIADDNFNGIFIFQTLYVIPLNDNSNTISRQEYYIFRRVFYQDSTCSQWSKWEDITPITGYISTNEFSVIIADADSKDQPIISP